MFIRVGYLPYFNPWLLIKYSMGLWVWTNLKYLESIYTYTYHVSSVISNSIWKPSKIWLLIWTNQCFIDKRSGRYSFNLLNGNGVLILFCRHEQFGTYYGLCFLSIFPSNFWFVFLKPNDYFAAKIGCLHA